MTIKFLSNYQNNNHKLTLEDNFKLYQEVFIAVAFLKVSGLNKLIQTIKEFLKFGGQINIIAGQNFALTEPIALHTFRNLFKDYPTSKIYLAKANTANSIFHPKLYLFKAQDECSIISGSANITEGGLVCNKETSLLADCNSTDKIWIEAKKYFDYLISDENADEATLLVIKQYETFFEQQRQHNKKSKAIPTRTKSQLAFDYKNLLKHFRNFNDAERQKNFKGKTLDYNEARKILNSIAENTRLTQKEFEHLLDKLVGSKDENNVWHSGSLFRLRKKVYPYYKQFRELVIYIRDNKNLSPTTLFNNAKEKVATIEGAAVNYITEIMMTYNIEDFANMNKNPLTVLRKEGGVNIKASSSSFTGTDYEEYCDLVKEISRKLGLRNMLEADSFFNEIYWKIAETKPK